MNNFNTPILFLIFNRLDTTKQVFEIIRQVKPSRLYLASDGPRDSKEGETEKVNIVREHVINSIDWNCDVKTLFRDKNLGCGIAVSDAITWFFKNEEMGVILEDDCLPSLSFFSFCEELLIKYKDNERIFHIAGNNSLTLTSIPCSYFFTRIMHCWGWASWRRAWINFNYNISNLNDFIKQKKINTIFKRNVDREHWVDIFKNIENPKNDIWDYQWCYSIYNNNGICIIPYKNLITNIGIGTEETHPCPIPKDFEFQERFDILEIIHPEEIIINNKLTNLINKNIYNIKFSFLRIIKKIIKNIIGQKLSSKIKYYLK